MKVVVHEETLNKLFAAIGEINGASDYKLLFFSGKYYWTVKNPKMELKPGIADYIADVQVRTGMFSYSSQIIGDVAITYNLDSNLIEVKVTRAVFAIYTKILGRKFHVKDVDIARYYKEPFTFEGPATMETNMEFTLPDNSVKRITAKPSSCDVIVENDQIVVPCEIEFISEIIPRK